VQRELEKPNAQRNRQKRIGEGEDI